MAKRERGTGGLFKMKGSNNWYAQIYREGRPCRVSTKTDVKQEAQAFLRNLLTDADHGKPFVGDTKKIRYGDLRHGLIQDYIAEGNKSLLVNADGIEFINGLAALDKFFEYEAGTKPGVPLSQITTDAARAFATERLKAGVTNSTVNNSLALLRRMLNIRRDDGKLQQVPKIRLLKANNPRKGFLARDRFDELVSHLPAHMRPLITFLYWCGVRLGEALQIDWSQVNLDRATIQLEGEQTKTGEPRIVPLPDVLMTMLKKSKRHGKVFDGTNLRKAWGKACAAARLGTLGEADERGNRRYSGLIIHDLRRSAIKNLMKAGVREQVAMAISGHKTRSVFERYNISDDADVVNAMRSLQDAPAKMFVSESSVRASSTTPRRKRLTH